MEIKKLVDIDPLTIYVDKIISGGQIGVDLIGLQTAQKLGYETGGFVPPFYCAIKENAPLIEQFGLVEYGNKTAPYATQLVERSMKNVDSSDLTILFHTNPSSPGTLGTLRYCMSGSWKGHSKITIPQPYLFITSTQLADKKTWGKIRDDGRKLIATTGTRIVNIAGSRDVGNFDNAIREILTLILKK